MGSFGSLNPKFAAANVNDVSSAVVTAPSVPTGALFTGVTLMVSVFGEASRSTPPLAVPPLSRTWDVNVVYGLPLAPGDGVKVKKPAPMLAAETSWPAVTGTLLFFNTPAAGNVVTRTAASTLESFGSLKPKFPAANVRTAPSTVPTVLSAPAGTSLIESIVKETVAVDVFGSGAAAVVPSSCSV